MTHLLDTNAWIVYLKSPQSRIRERLEKLEFDELNKSPKFITTENDGRVFKSALIVPL